MGNKIFKSKVVRPVKNYNIEERAMKAISRDKPTQAPTYEGPTKQMMDKIREDPNLLLKRATLNPGLAKNLKEVYLKSHGDWPELTTTRTMPKLRSTTATHAFEYGYEEPEKVREGMATLRQMVQLLSDHQNNPEVWTPEKIASQYKLKVEEVEDIIKYFKPFQVFSPPKRDEPSILMKAIKA